MGRDLVKSEFNMLRFDFKSAHAKHRAEADWTNKAHAWNLKWHSKTATVSSPKWATPHRGDDDTSIVYREVKSVVMLSAQPEAPEPSSKTRAAPIRRLVTGCRTSCQSPYRQAAALITSSPLATSLADCLTFCNYVKWYLFRSFWRVKSSRTRRTCDGDSPESPVDVCSLWGAWWLVCWSLRAACSLGTYGVWWFPARRSALKRPSAPPPSENPREHIICWKFFCINEKILFYRRLFVLTLPRAMESGEWQEGRPRDATTKQHPLELK